jgi:hypothetical protein
VCTLDWLPALVFKFALKLNFISYLLDLCLTSVIFLLVLRYSLKMLMMLNMQFAVWMDINLMVVDYEYASVLSFYSLK